MSVVHDLTRKTFGQLFVLGRSESDVHRNMHWLCECSCGKKITVVAFDLKRGHTKSCGHLRGHAVKHGAAKRKQKWPEYRVWQTMKQRCFNRKSPKYRYYGGRGISVCARWRNNFQAFIADMGRRPDSKVSVDRINNEGNYEPTNCRWATQSQQRRNSRPASKMRERQAAANVQPA